MVDRIRTEFQRVMTGEGGGKRMSQAELDSYRRQLVMLAVTGVTVLVVLILGIGAFYQYVYLPRQAVAEVGDETISKTDYWDFRKYQLLTQINQYQQLAQMMEGQQADQYQQLAVQANQEFEDIQGADVDPTTVDEMINNRILLNALDDFDIEITDEEIDDYLVEYFAGQPVGEQSEGPSADPTAQAWATATAEAQQEATPEEGAGEESGSEESEGDGGADSADQSGDQQSEDSSNEGSEGADAESESTPTAQPTPAEEEIRATAETNRFDHERFLLDRADLSEDEFIDMIIRPNIAREKIRERLAQDVPTRAEQVNAAHILVATEEAANQIYEDLTSEDAPEFAAVAEEQSADSQTAPNGGDLGWFPRGVMVPQFDEVVFDLEAGEISEPFQTEFGWHIATVQEREEDRPVSLQVLNQLRQQAFNDWLQEQRESIDIDTEGFDLPEDPGQAQGQFQPPASAPDPPQPEMPTQPDVQVPSTEGEGDGSGEGESTDGEGSSGEDQTSDEAEPDDES